MMRKKEQIIMLTSSICVLAALTATGVYVKENNAREKEKEYRLDLSQIAEETPVEDAPNNDLDYEPDIEDAASGEVRNEVQRLLNLEERNDTELEFATENSGESVLEEQVEEIKPEIIENVEEESAITETIEVPEENAEVQETEAQNVITKELHFDAAKTLTLPIVGNVIIGYSMDVPVYYATLEQYRLSPALVIAATPGTEVCAMCDAQITRIETTPTLGTQVTMSLGDGYECIYAQLCEVPVEVGSFVEAGQMIGKIAEPTKYYSVEGPNLYLAMRRDEKPVDPMSFMND